MGDGTPAPHDQLMNTSRFAVRFLLFQGAVLLGSAWATAVVAASPHWGAMEPWFFFFMIGLAMPACLLLAAACRTATQTWVTAGLITGMLALSAQEMAADDSSTASLVFLGFQFLATAAGLAAAVARAAVEWHRRRSHQA